ncbi:MAG: cellulose biosynthesis protein BcsN [Rhizobium sp.]|nr:cellulose biosynthesis protein BcsN [Rhizobium sp.]
MKPLFLLALACLPLASCTSVVDDPWLTDRGVTSSVGKHQANRELSSEMASMHLAALGEAPIAVRRLSRDGVRVEQIVYANKTTVAGENMLTVETASTAATAKAPSREALAREMRAAMPDVAMATTPVLGSNAYGRYGAAVGAMQNGSKCVYAWQMIDKLPVAGRNGLGGSAQGSAKIRLRYCEAGKGGRDLASLLSSLAAGAGPARSLSFTSTQPVSSTAYAYSAAPPAEPEVGSVALTAKAVETKTTAAVPTPQVSTSIVATAAKSAVIVPIPLPQ